MEELLELRTHIEAGRYGDALLLLGEMEEMSRDDKINKIESYLEILLLHLIKKQAEKRSTKSWEASISNAIHHINRTNKRRKTKGYYLTKEEVAEAIDEAWVPALIRASIEAFEGRYSDTEIAEKVDKQKIKEETLFSLF